MKTLIIFISLFLIFSSSSFGQDLEISCDSDYSQECAYTQLGNQNFFNEPIISGGCEPYSTEMWFSYGEENTSCAWSTTYHWQVVDSCGNTASCQATEFFYDTTPPDVNEFIQNEIYCMDFVVVVSEEMGDFEYRVDDISASPGDLYFYDCNPFLSFFSSGNFLEEVGYEQGGYEVEVVSYYGCGTSALLEFTFGDACGNVGTYQVWSSPIGEYCDDPNSCEYDSYGVDYWTGDGIGTGYGCENFYNDQCWHSESDSYGNLGSDCECQILGCMEVGACNYSEAVTEDDGSCLFGSVGCTDELALNYNDESVCSDVCLYETGDSNGDGQVTAVDLGEFLSSFGTSCPPLEYCFGDLNGDLSVTAADLAVFITLIGQ